MGVLLYGDPKDYAPGPKFPKGRWLPDDGVQRGSIIGYGDDVTEGDPMTRNYPAKSKFFFWPIFSLDLTKVFPLKEDLVSISELINFPFPKTIMIVGGIEV